jgi:hypothetical protein
MSTRITLMLAGLLSLNACFTKHDGKDDAGTHDAAVAAGRAPAGGDGAQASATRGAAGDSPDMAPELQVWVGAVHSRYGGGLVCGPQAADHMQERALLLLELEADGRVRAASLTLGEGPPLPAVEDPDAYYPPDPPYDWHGCPMRGLVPGFEYPVYDARLTATRLTATIHPADVVRAWCELQPSYRASPAAAAEWGEYLCRPTDQFDDPTELSDAIPHPPGEGPVGFEPEELCFNVNAPCLCDADSCTASPYGAFHLEVQLTGDLLSGRLGSIDIKLERRR